MGWFKPALGGDIGPILRIRYTAYIPLYEQRPRFRRLTTRPLSLGAHGQPPRHPARPVDVVSPERGRRFRSDEGRLYERLEKSLVQLRFNTLVVADRHTGTRVADVFTARLQASDHRVRRIRASQIDSLFGLLRYAGEPESLTVAEDDWRGLLRALAVTSNQHDQPRFVVVDQIPDTKFGWQLFGRARDDLWEIFYRWAVFITPEELAHYTIPPADTFFPTIIRVSDSG